MAEADTAPTEDRSHASPRSHHRRRKHRGRRLLAAVVVVSLLLVTAGGWVAYRARQADRELRTLRSLAERTSADAKAFRLAALGDDLSALGQQAGTARSISHDPLWWLAAQLPGPGRDAAAVRVASGVMAQVAAAAAPMAGALPRLTPDRLASTGRIDTAALAQVAAATAGLQTVVSSGTARVDSIDTAGLRPEVADAMSALRSALDKADGALSAAAPVLGVLPAMLGADGPRRIFLALENDAEARGAGGLIGAYAILSSDHGQVRLVRSASRKSLPGGIVIPTTGLPTDYLQLWGTDAQVWAGLDLSPHWPYTGQLVDNGWRKLTGQSLDAVVGLDQYVVAGLLAGTGPVAVRGVTVTAANAVSFLSKDIYREFPDVTDKDAVVGELVREVFQRLVAGQVDLAPLVSALREPVTQHRLTVWSSHPEEETKLAAMAVGGVLPDQPGPVVMPVINNGGGNKLDAYLRVDTTYDQGNCLGDVRLSQVVIRLTNTAPATGLPDYVVARPDRLELQEPPTVRGANRVLVDLYGPVDAEAPLVTVDDQQVEVSVGQERSHPVWGLAVELRPGQTRTVAFQVLQPVEAGLRPAISAPTVLLQPMAIPATARAVAGTACGAPGTG